MTLLLIQSSVYALPYVPDDPGQVLEVLPYNPAAKSIQDVQRLQADLRVHPENIASALEYAKLNIGLGHADADPRFYSYAESALLPLLQQDRPMAKALVYDAIIEQFFHHFDKSLNLLDSALNIEPSQEQARLTKAFVLMTIGEYEKAKHECARLLLGSAQLNSGLCIATVQSLQGNAVGASDLLQKILHDPSLNPSDQLSLYSLLGEIQQRLGNIEKAQIFFSSGEKLKVRDIYFLGAYSDFLLEQGENEKVIQLLSEETRVDNLLLRLTLAEKATNNPKLEDHIQQLQERYAATHVRGDQTHLREEARYSMELKHDITEAFNLAQKNWRIQKEPADAELLANTAYFAKSPDVAKEVRQFVSDNHLEDKKLDLLLTKLQELAS